MTEQPKLKPGCGNCLFSCVDVKFVTVTGIVKTYNPNKHTLAAKNTKEQAPYGLGQVDESLTNCIRFPPVKRKCPVVPVYFFCGEWLPQIRLKDREGGPSAPPESDVPKVTNARERYQENCKKETKAS